jgi:hypothetical protein
MKPSPSTRPATRGCIWSVVILLFLLSALSAPAQTYIFGRADFPVGGLPVSIATGDFNGDGILDFAVANEADNTVSVLLGKSDGTFAAQVTYATGLGPLAITTGDFNGDGNLDLAVTDANCVPTKGGLICDAKLVSILLGNGDGSFQPHIDYATGTQPSSIAAGDFNGDGKLDLVVANAQDGTVSVLLGNGDGTFQTQVVYPIERGAYSVIVADFNGDHKLDLAVGGGQVVSLLLGNGDGTFQKPLSSPGGSPLAAADFNGDGKLDLYAGGDILLGKGDGTFVLNATYPGAPAAAAVDLNGDGKPDLVLAQSSLFSVAVLLGNGDGTFQPGVEYGAAPFSSALVIADFNGDGKFDLALAEPDCASTSCGTPGAVSILLGLGDGTFVTGKDYSPGGGVIAADFNGDGKPDLAVDGNPVGVYLGNGDGTFQPEVTSPCPQCGGIAAGDFNGDGKADLATSFQNCSNHTCNPGFAGVLIGNGDGTFQPAVEYVVGLQPGTPAVGDFNGDGKPDLAVTNFGANTVSILLNSGNGTFQSHVDYPVGVEPQSIATGDFKDDGVLDLVVGNSVDNNITILLGNGNGTFTPGALVAAGEGGFAVADFNGDGKLDLAVTAANQVLILLGNGDGTFQAPVGYSAGSEGLFGGASVGDFNGDGKPDLIIGGTDIATILLGNGDGTFQPPMYTFLSSGLVAVADFNQDGVPDVAAATGLAPPAFSVMLSVAFKAVSPGSLNFGSQGVGTTSAPHTITISNPSNVKFNIASIVASGNFSQTNDCGASLVPGAHCDVTVKFTPTATGLESGAITVADSTKISPLAIPLSGTGVNGPFLTPYPSRADFAARAVGTSSNPFPIVLVNTGNASMNINSISIAGADSSDFTQINNCTNSLPVAGSCTVKVTFIPSASGSRTGNIVVSDTAPGSPQRILMSGAGGGFAISAAPLSPALVSPGKSATTTVTSTSGGGFNQSVTLSCGSITLNGAAATTAPPTCKFSPSSLSNGSGNSTLTISTTAASASLVPASTRSRGRFYAVLLPILGMVLMGTGFGSRGKKRFSIMLLLLAMTSLLFLAACGGGGSDGGGGGGTVGTPAGSYTISILGSAGSMVNATKVTLTVQ